MYQKEINKYLISHYSGREDRNYEYRSLVNLMDSEGQTIGVLYFHRDEETVPDMDSMSNAGYPMIHYPDCEYDIILDLLRNESPVYVRYIEGQWKIGNIRTSVEPVGEGEADQS